MNTVKDHKMQEKISTLELSSILNISTRRVNQLTNDGIFKRIARGKYDHTDSIQRFIEYKIELEKNKYIGNDTTINEAIRRKTIAEAELKEIEVQKARDELVEKNKVVEFCTGIINVSKIKLLAIPAKITPLILNLGNPKKIRLIIDEEIRSALNELARLKKV